MDEGTITILCDNEDCDERYTLLLDTLRAVQTVTITCKKCGEIQKIKLNDREELQIWHIM